jgi:hypothetical protein
MFDKRCFGVSSIDLYNFRLFILHRNDDFLPAVFLLYCNYIVNSSGTNAEAYQLSHFSRYACKEQKPFRNSILLATHRSAHGLRSSSLPFLW